MSLQRRLVVGSSVAAVAALLAGCGSSAPPAAAPVAEASASVAAPTATPTPTPSPTPTAVYSLTTATFASAMNAAAAKATSCTFTLEATDTSGAITANGVTRVGPKGSEVSMKLTTSAGAMDLRVVGGIWYISGGQLTGGKFVKGDPTDPKGPFAGMTGIFDSVNPGQGMASDQDAVVSVTPAGGTEAIGGVPTQAYDVVVDTAKLTAAVRAQQFDDKIALPAQVTYRYWFGADGLVRKMIVDVQGEHQVMTFSGWGEPVDIQAPPANQVVTLK